jgi:hypothetical protein
MIEATIEQQSKIGWLNLIRGYMTKKGYLFASTYFSESAEEEIQDCDDGSQRVQQILKAFLHTMTQQVWHGQNKVLHQTAANEEHKQLTAMDTEIMKYNREPDLVLSSDRFYCEQSCTCLLRTNVSRVKVSCAKKAYLLSNGQSKITTYLGPAQSHHSGNMSRLLERAAERYS